MSFDAESSEESICCPICPDFFSAEDEQVHLRGHEHLMFRCLECVREDPWSRSPIFLRLQEVAEHQVEFHPDICSRGRADSPLSDISSITLSDEEDSASGATVICPTDYNKDTCSDPARAAVLPPMDVRSIQCLKCGLLLLSRGTLSMVLHLQQQHPESIRDDLQGSFSDRLESAFSEVALFGCRLCGASFNTHNDEVWEKHFRDGFGTCRDATGRFGTREHYESIIAGKTEKESVRFRAFPGTDKNKNYTDFFRPRREAKRQNRLPERPIPNSFKKPHFHFPRRLFCPFCRVSATGPMQLQQHLKGSKHWAKIKDLGEIAFTCFAGCSVGVVDRRMSPEKFLEHVTSQPHLERLNAISKVSVEEKTVSVH